MNAFARRTLATALVVIGTFLGAACSGGGSGVNVVPPAVNPYAPAPQQLFGTLTTQMQSTLGVPNVGLQTSPILNSRIGAKYPQYTEAIFTGTDDVVTAPAAIAPIFSGPNELVRFSNFPTQNPRFPEYFWSPLSTLFNSSGTLMTPAQIRNELALPPGSTMAYVRINGQLPAGGEVDVGLVSPNAFGPGGGVQLFVWNGAVATQTLTLDQFYAQEQQPLAALR